MAEPEAPPPAAPPAPPAAAPPPAPPAPPAVAPEPEPEVPAALSDDEVAQLADLQARQQVAVAGPAPVMLKVEPPHALFIFGGRSVGPDFTPVPAGEAAAIMTAADDAGVTITQQEG